MRNLIDKALTGATSCCRLSAPHHRRDGLVCFGPWHGQEALALSRAAVEAKTRMTYEKRRSGSRVGDGPEAQSAVPDVAAHAVKRVTSAVANGVGHSLP